MQSKSQRALQIFLVSILLLMSCDVSTFAVPQQILTPIPGAVNMIVAQTAAAAATQTAALIPPTLTSTLTPFPTQTPLDTPTMTPTFIFIMFTPTSSVTPTSYINITSTSSVSTTAPEFSCSKVSQSPANGTKFNAGAPFTLNWKVKNTGTSDWLSTSIDLDYVSGTQFTSATVIGLSSTITPGNSVTLSIPMNAPSTSGTYTTNWSLAAGAVTFCHLSLKITVK